MNSQEKFYNLPTGEAAPLNRRVYDLAKIPFSFLFGALWLVIRPWAMAFPFAMIAAGVISYLVNQDAIHNGALWSVAEQTLSVGLVWTGYLGAAIVAVIILRALFE